MARVLRARQVGTGVWFQRVDSGDKAESAFKTEVASQFGVAEANVEVVVTEWTEAQRLAAVSEMATGTHGGQAVTAAAIAPPDPPDDPLLQFVVKQLNDIRAALPAPLPEIKLPDARLDVEGYRRRKAR